MTWQQFCAWCTTKGLDQPTVIARVSEHDKFPYYVQVTWIMGSYQGSKGYGIAAQTPTAEELQEIVNNPCLPF